MESLAKNEHLTTPEFWDRFWGSVKLPVLPDPGKRYEKCFLDVFERIFSYDPGLTVFEAGCAPGMWLAYFHRAFGYRPSGVDSSPRGVALTEENFRLCGVPGRVQAEDFLTYQPAAPFDVVVSLGFIEHFQDPGLVLRKHLDLLKPGGRLVLEVPNLTGLNAWLQDPDLLAAHNRSVMSREFFVQFAAEAGLHALFLDYIGGFEPDNLGPPRDAIFKRVVLKVLRQLRRLPGSGRLNGRYVSGFLLGIFRKPGETRPQ